MSDYAALASRIRTSLWDIEKSVERSLELSTKARTTGDDGYWDGVALNLHSFYTGIEHILEDIARTLEKGLPSGSGWHADLLTQMSGEIENVRPAVISRETRNKLDEFRGLRHVVRNVYAFNLRSARLDELIADLPDCFQAVQSDLLSFAEFLESI
jgi:ribonuclease HepT-like protein